MLEEARNLVNMVYEAINSLEKTRLFRFTRNDISYSLIWVNVKFFLLCILCSLFFIASAGHAAQSSQKIRIALYPLENLTDDKTALEQIMPVLKGQLEARGLEITDENSLNKFLLKERIRSTGYISKDIAQKIGKELNVRAILVGSINSFYTQKNPQVGLLARLIDSTDGSILWSNQASATGEDFTKILGLGTVTNMDRLISIVTDRLLASFNITPPHKEKELTHRIAVMPFQNKSRHKDAGMIATYMFLVELFKNKGFEPLEYGEIRRMIVDLRVRHRGELDYNSIKALSENLGVEGILVGTVDFYSDGLDTSSSPEVAISARLINTRKNRIIWSDSIHLNGDEAIVIFDWGKIRSVDNVACRVVTKLIQRMATAKWQ
jgi:TolB-like protein